MKKVILMVLFLIFGAYMIFSDEVKIYFTNWNYVRRSSLSEDDVLIKPDIFFHITDQGEIRRLKRHLTSDLVKFEGIVSHVDIVIDFISNEQILETFIVNKFGFYKKGFDCLYKTPEIILQRFTFLQLLPKGNEL